MASIEELQEAERNVQELLEREGVPEPDEIEFGETCIRLLWHEAKVAVVIDVD